VKNYENSLALDKVIAIINGALFMVHIVE